jgi:hypothetical protein
MKLVNPPVALMFHEGARRLAAVDVHLPGLLNRNSSKIALEAYPGLLARKQLGIRDSYKSDTRREQTPARQAVRRQILQALKVGKPLRVRLEMPRRIEKLAVADGTGDTLDALICAAQAAWGWTRKESNFGLRPGADSAEGWIVSA